MCIASCCLHVRNGHDNTVKSLYCAMFPGQIGFNEHVEMCVHIPALAYTEIRICYIAMLQTLHIPLKCCCVI